MITEEQASGMDVWVDIGMYIGGMLCWWGCGRSKGWMDSSVHPVIVEIAGNL